MTDCLKHRAAFGSCGFPKILLIFFGGRLGFLKVLKCACEFGGRDHTPSIAFRHLPPNSARFRYATEGVLFISAQLSSDAVSALRKVPVLI